MAHRPGWARERRGSKEKEAEDTKGPATVDLQHYPPISMQELEKLLVPDYIQKIPEFDPWGNPYEMRLNVENVLAEHIMSIRSPGRDGQYETDFYEVKEFDPEDYDQDIVWTDGFFSRWPQKVRDRAREN